MKTGLDIRTDINTDIQKPISMLKTFWWEVFGGGRLIQGAASSREERAGS